MRTLGIAFAALMITGCATQPIATSKAAPTDEVLKPTMVERRAGTYPVTVKRDTGLMCGAWDQELFINGDVVAELSTGEKVTVYLAEGNHILGARIKGTCAGGLTELRIEVSAGEQLVYRISMNQSGDSEIQPTAF